MKNKKLPWQIISAVTLDRFKPGALSPPVVQLAGVNEVNAGGHADSLSQRGLTVHYSEQSNASAALDGNGQ